jgi:hypothetical protein
MAKARKKAKKLTAKKQSVKDLGTSKARSVKGGVLGGGDRPPRAVKLT